MKSDNEAKLALGYAHLGLGWNELIEVCEALLAVEEDKDRIRRLETSIKYFKKWKAEATQPGIAMQTCWDDDNPLEGSGVRELKLDGSDYTDALNWSDGDDNG